MTEEKFAFGSKGCGWLIVGIAVAVAIVLLITYLSLALGISFDGLQMLRADDLVATQVAETVVAQQTQAAFVMQQTQTAGTQQAMVELLAAQLTQLAAPQAVAGAADVDDTNEGIPPVAVVADPNSDKPQATILLQANVREGPGITCKAFSALLKDSVVPVLSKNKEGSWLEIGLPDGKTGWIATSVTNAFTVGISNVVVASNPPICPATATPTPTGKPAAAMTATPTWTPTDVSTTQLEKKSWQVEFTYLGGSRKLQVTFTQDGKDLSGLNRDNNAEVDIKTSGKVKGNTVVITFELENGGSPRGTVTCSGTISGSPQTISGSFTATDGFGASSGNCTFR